MDTRIRRFVITMHNYQKEDWTKQKFIDHVISKWLVDYIIVGEEITNDNSIPHYQIYIEFTNPTTQKQVIERLNTITQLKPHVEAAKGDASSNKIYCSKTDNFLEYGTITQKLYVDDIAVNVIIALHQGQTILKILLENKEYATYIIRNFKNLQNIEQAIKFEQVNLLKNSEEKDILDVISKRLEEQAK
jgi:hypothetical protein